MTQSFVAHESPAQQCHLLLYLSTQICFVPVLPQGCPLWEEVQRLTTIPCQATPDHYRGWVRNSWHGASWIAHLISCGFFFFWGGTLGRSPFGYFIVFFLVRRYMVACVTRLSPLRDPRYTTASHSWTSYKRLCCSELEK